MFWTLLASFSLITTAIAQDGEPHGSAESKIMGPVAFLYPPDRPWTTDEDNIAPCGSSAGVTNRTDFPTTGGAIALVIQDDSWAVQVAISYNDNPNESSTFTLLISPSRIPEVDDGHQCYPLPSAPSDRSFPLNATIQLIYTSDFGGKEEGNGKNETYYACADIRYVEDLKPDVLRSSCFNVTSDEFVANNETKTNMETATGTGGPAAPTAAVNAMESSRSGLSGGGIAGVVVGVVIGVALVVIAAVMVYRRKQRKISARGVEASKRRMAEGEEVELRDR